MNDVRFFVALFVGFGVSVYGARRGWSLVRLALTSYALGTLASLFISIAFAEEPAFTKLRETTVHIAIGSGSIVEGKSGSHYLLTNWHVCNAGSWKGNMQASYEKGELVQGKITKLNPLFDLCAIKLNKQPKSLKLAKTLAPGQKLYTRGYPFGVLSESSGQFVGIGRWEYAYDIEEVGECFKGSVKLYNGHGRVSACSVTYTDNMTNIYSRPGSSGSPVVDASGDLVGVMSSWDANDDRGGMVQLENVQEFFKGL